MLVALLCMRPFLSNGLADESWAPGRILVTPFASLGRAFSELGNSAVTHGAHLIDNWPRSEPMDHPEYYIQVDEATLSSSSENQARGFSVLRTLRKIMAY
jgi:hypothetical protein